MLLGERSKKRVLIVDDEAAVRDSLKLLLSRVYEVEATEDGEKALVYLKEANNDVVQLSKIGSPAGKRGHGMPDVVLLDVMMPGVDGLQTLEKVSAEFPNLPVIMLTATRTVKTAVKAMKLGAVDYLSKPFDVDELLTLIENITSHKNTLRQKGEIVSFELPRPELVPGEGDFGSLVGNNQLMKDVYRRVAQVADRDATVLITGDSGTGKELIARELHLRSKRAAGAFVAINCAAIPESLIESEIFGHEKGAFTHAVEKRIGHFELADKGTLFLDEIGELSLNVQVKLLRFLQEQEFYRLGRSKAIKVDVRVVAATNKNLENAIAEGRFRQDLFYRLNVVAIEMPTLKERPDDIEPLIKFFIKRLGKVYGDRKLELDQGALEVLTAYAWPGNVRELENIIESMLALAPNDKITIDDIPARIKNGLARNTSPKKPAEFDLSNLNFEDAEKVFESDIILKALQQTNYVQTKAADLLGISRRILKYKMDKLGISDKQN